LRGYTKVDISYVDLLDKPEWLSAVSSAMEVPAARLPGATEWIDSSAAIVDGMAARDPSVAAVMARHRQPALEGEAKAALWGIVSAAFYALVGRCTLKPVSKAPGRCNACN
jgi:hypothetical protein